MSPLAPRWLARQYSAIGSFHLYLSYTNPRPLRPTNMGVLRNKSGLIFALMQSIKKFLFFPANFINFWDLQGPVETLSGRYLTPWRRPKTSRSSNHFSLDQHFANSGKLKAIDYKCSWNSELAGNLKMCDIPVIDFWQKTTTDKPICHRPLVKTKDYWC